MILNRLKLVNFGPFRGEHEFVLAPENGKGGQPRRIILFGGKNGTGKTTILTAVRLCLFGPLAFGSRVGEEQYAQHLAECAHRPGDGDTAANLTAVELEFDYVIMGKEERFRVRREWDPTAASPEEHVSVVTDGEHGGERVPEQWDQFVRHLVPPGVADLFFFDGEAIQGLADDSLASGRLAESVASLLGLDLVDRLGSDLVAYQRYHLLQQLGQEKQREVRERERQLEVLRGRRSSLLQDRAQQQSQAERLEAEIEQKREQLAREGGMLPEEIAELKARSGALRDTVQELESEAREICASELPPSLCQSLANRLREQLLAERAVSAERYGQEMLQSLLPELASELRLRGAGGVPEGEDKSESAHLTDTLRESVAAIIARRKGATPTDTIHDLSQSQSQEISRVLNELLPRAMAAARKVAEQLVEARAQLESLQRRLSRLPDDQHLAHLVEPLRVLQGRRDDVAGAQANTEGELRSLEAEIAEAEREVSRELARSRRDREAVDETERKRQLVAGLRQALSHYRGSLVEERVADLGDVVSRNFRLLSRKGDRAATVELRSPGLEIAVRDSRGRKIPHGSLSAGERQVLAITFLWSLAQLSRRQLPVIIDTPLARLDGDHRGNLIRHYFPEASHQMIVLSTDTEVDLELFRRLAPKVARAHRLEYDEADAATHVSTGYFWRAQG